MRFVIDTNVPIVANGRADSGGVSGMPSVACRLASIEFIEQMLQRGILVVDLAGEIQAEYHRHLNPKGQPGVGDRFYQTVLNSAPERVERIDVDKDGIGNYVDFPTDPSLNNFDPSDRKFAALARKAGVPVANSTDSDWLNSRTELHRNGIAVEFLCGCDSNSWFQQ